MRCNCSFKTVVRFNLYKTLGFENDVGKRTDTWVLSTIKDPADASRRETWPLKHVFIPVPHGYTKKKKETLKQRLMDAKLLRERVNVWVGSLEPEAKELRKDYGLNEKYISSGLQMISFYHRRQRIVYILGFDFESGDHQVRDISIGFECIG